MGYTVQYPFTFPHGKRIVVMLSDRYDNNYISYDMAKRLSAHPKMGSFCYHEERHFIISLGIEETTLIMLNVNCMNPLRKIIK